MAIPSDTVWEVNTTGSDTAAGGGFSSANKGAAGTDMTYPTPTVTTFTSNLSAVGTTTLTCSSALFTNTMQGNVIQISGQGFYCITGFTSATVVTVDRSLGTFTTTSGWVGGALASPGQAGSVAVANNAMYIKAGTYTISSATANISGGCVTWPASSGGTTGRIVGYQTTRGDYGTRPLLQASGISTFTIVKLGQKTRADNLSVDGASLTGSQGIASGSNTDNYAYLCKAVNCKNGGIATAIAARCEISGCATVAACGSPYSYLCWSHDNTVTGFSPSGTFSGAANYIFCISSNNTGASSDGFFASSNNGEYVNCTAYASGRDGFRATVGSSGESTFLNCIATNNTGFGFNVSSAANQNQGFLINCAGISNTSGNVNTINTLDNVGFVTLTASPYIAVASNNFALNAMQGGGAACRAAGLPGAVPGASTTGYQDIGIQSRVPWQTTGMDGGMGG